MSILKRIYKNEYEVYPFENNVTVKLTINNVPWYGTASCAPEDMDFFSTKIGTWIALSRARIEAIKYYLNEVTEEYTFKFNILNEITDHKNKDITVIDPTNAIRNNLNNVHFRMKKLENALKKEKNNLRRLLKDQEFMVRSIIRYREIKDKQVNDD